ncbi:hypothetical protein CN106_30025, partial [Sinorhizobium meliloti]
MMIIVVEGISAAGKTTWCKSHGQSNLIPETFPADRKAQPLTGCQRRSKNRPRGGAKVGHCGAHMRPPGGRSPSG